MTTTSDLQGLISELESNIRSVFLGNPDVVRSCLVALIAGEHILLEDVPGVGKTLLGKALAKSVEGSFCRIQFTPDLLPNDIVGSTVYTDKSSEFVFHPGPVFANVVLGDEINRAPPRTQSALLEAMGDRQVSVDGDTYHLPKPFMVVATQNPFEFEGTYPLPESQLDRFLMTTSLGYPDRKAEYSILVSHRDGEPVDSLPAVLSAERVVEIQRVASQIRVDDAIVHFMLNMVEATRQSGELRLGVSPRGALALYRACQSYALLEQRDYVIPDDVKRIAVDVLAHRIVPGSDLAIDRPTLRALVRDIISNVVVPT